LKKIYLDHNATTPLAPEVLEVMIPVLGEVFGNPSSIHSEGRRARVRIDEAREKAADLIGCSPGEIVFTSGGTESNNFALLGVALGGRGEGRHIITCQTEHPSVLNPCRQLEKSGFQVDYLPVDREGRIDLEQLKRTITRSTILISLQHANSEMGTLHDIEKIGGVARDNGILFHTDAVQSVGKIAVNVKDIAVDLLSFSSHKLNGPKGSGVLYVRKGCPELFSPVCGGDQEKKRRGGTENVAGIVGLGKACELAKARLQSGGVEKLQHLRDYLFQRLCESLTGIEVLGDKQCRLPNTLNLSIAGAEGETLLIGLDVKGISVSTGSACSSGSPLPSHVLTAMQVPEDRIRSSLRISLGWSNTEEEMDTVAKTLCQLVHLNRKKKAAFG